jgi:flavin-binding protein dodecin
MALARQVGSGQKLPPPNAILSLSGSGRHPRIGVEILMLDFLRHPGQEDDTPDSVYKVIELVGTSDDSWEKAAANAVEQAAKSLRDLRIAEVVKLDMQLDDKGKVEAYRAKLNVSFQVRGLLSLSTSPHAQGEEDSLEKARCPVRLAGHCGPVSEVGPSPTGTDML